MVSHHQLTQLGRFVQYRVSQFSPVKVELVESFPRCDRNYVGAAIVWREVPNYELWLMVRDAPETAASIVEELKQIRNLLRALGLSKADYIWINEEQMVGFLLSTAQKPLHLLPRLESAYLSSIPALYPDFTLDDIAEYYTEDFGRSVWMAHYILTHKLGLVAYPAGCNALYTRIQAAYGSQLTDSVRDHVGQLNHALRSALAKDPEADISEALLRSTHSLIARKGLEIFRTRIKRGGVQDILDNKV